MYTHSEWSRSADSDGISETMICLQGFLSGSAPPAPDSQTPLRTTRAKAATEEPEDLGAVSHVSAAGARHE